MFPTGPSFFTPLQIPVPRSPDGDLIRQCTLFFLVQGNPIERILLGMKKTGFGSGRFNGIGGKLETGETEIEAAIRELEEEISVDVKEIDAEKVGEIDFFFPANPEWDQTVHLYLAREWTGNPVESVEMAPQWFPVSSIPYEKMWNDDRHWLPYVLSGKRILASFTFEKDNSTVSEHWIRTVENFGDGARGLWWTREFGGAITISDVNGRILEMNQKSKKTFAKDGGGDLVGKNVLDCHPPRARAIFEGMMTGRKTNAYTVEKNGVKKLIYQAPWTRDGKYAGFVELSLEIPFEMPHFVRKPT
jgi:8-oxo-dGTP pyrophosphatase MutT (NUDIX family)